MRVTDAEFENEALERSAFDSSVESSRAAAVASIGELSFLEEYSMALLLVFLLPQFVLLRLHPP